MKRTPLRRKKSISPVRRTDSDLETARRAVKLRARDKCELRISPECKMTGWQVHHRKLRSQGGDHAVSGLLLLCGPCHEYVHRNPERAYKHGWLVESWRNPAEVPVEKVWRP